MKIITTKCPHSVRSLANFRARATYGKDAGIIRNNCNSLIKCDRYAMSYNGNIVRNIITKGKCEQRGRSSKMVIKKCWRSMTL